MDMSKVIIYYEVTGITNSLYKIRCSEEAFEIIKTAINLGFKKLNPDCEVVYQRVKE